MYCIISDNIPGSPQTTQTNVFSVPLLLPHSQFRNDLTPPEQLLHQGQLGTKEPVPQMMHPFLPGPNTSTRPPLLQVLLPPDINLIESAHNMIHTHRKSVPTK